jgi:hypothetical protein
MNTHIDNARILGDAELLDRVKALAARERGATAELIAHLAEVDARELHLESGHPSMYVYCRRALKLSEHGAYHRIEAARAARRFPVILDRLAEGALTLTTVKVLARHLTEDNHVEVLESARGRSRSEVENIVARLAPVPDAPTSIRKIPNSPAQAAVVEQPGVAAAPASPPAAPPLLTAPPLAAMPTPATPRVEPRPAIVNALSPDRYKLQLTISGDTLERLRLAKDMLRHAISSGDEAQILDHALRLLLTDLARKRFSVTEHPRPPRGIALERHEVEDLVGSRHIPAEVKRVVFVRDLGRCAFVGKDGCRCNERSRLEFHHVRPYSEGGQPTADNIELRCRAHNRYEWRLRSTHIRRREEQWHTRQLAAGVAPWSVPRPAQAAATSSKTSADSARAES